MVESTIPHFPDQERDVNNLSSGIYNSFLGFGQVLAPAYGAFVTEAFGFRVTADIVAVICLVFSIVYFAVAGGPEAFRNSCRSQRRSQVNDDFRKLAALKADHDDTISGKSHRSRLSSFRMLGPTTPVVSRMRIQSTIEDLSPALFEHTIGEDGERVPASPIRKVGGNRTRRLFSDIGAVAE